MITYESYAQIRNSKGLKDSDICRMTGIPQSTFSEWKNGKYVPKSDKMAKIAAALEMDYYDFIGPIGRFSAYSKDISKNMQQFQENMVPMLDGMKRLSESPEIKKLQSLCKEIRLNLPTIDIQRSLELLALFQNATDDAQKSVVTFLQNTQKEK